MRSRRGLRRQMPRGWGAIRAMFERFGFAAAEADVRARTVYLTQIGYISMQVREDMATRLSRVPDYVRAFFRHIRHGNRTCALSCPVEICTCRIGLWAALGTRTCGLCGTRQRRGHTRRQSQSAWGRAAAPAHMIWPKSHAWMRVVPQEGLEPPTLSLRRTCSTS